MIVGSTAVLQSCLGLLASLPVARLDQKHRFTSQLPCSAQALVNLGICICSVQCMHSHFVPQLPGAASISMQGNWFLELYDVVPFALLAVLQAPSEQAVAASHVQRHP